MEKHYLIPRPGHGPCTIEKIACMNFKVGMWSVSMVFRYKGKKFLSVLMLETGNSYTNLIA